LANGHSRVFFEASDRGEEDYGFVVLGRLALTEVDGCYAREVEGAKEVLRLGFVGRGSL
jgi:hypothetical protein